MTYLKSLLTDSPASHQKGLLGRLEILHNLLLNIFSYVFYYQNYHNIGYTFLGENQ